jgi:hypothetical protein
MPTTEFVAASFNGIPAAWAVFNGGGILSLDPLANHYSGLGRAEGTKLADIETADAVRSVNECARKAQAK